MDKTRRNKCFWSTIVKVLKKLITFVVTAVRASNIQAVIFTQRLFRQWSDWLGGLWKEAMQPTYRWVTPPIKVASLWIKDQNTDFSKWTAKGGNYYITTQTAPHTYPVHMSKGQRDRKRSKYFSFLRCICYMCVCVCVSSEPGHIKLVMTLSSQLQSYLR